jgi:hypothetical protein
MEWIPEVRRKRGCPRKIWMEGVQAAMTARNLEFLHVSNRLTIHHQYAVIVYAACGI